MIEQIQMHVNLLKLLDYQLKEVLKMHTDTYVTLNTFIYIHNISNITINNSINPKVKNMQIVHEDEDENKPLLINDIDSESENEIIYTQTSTEILEQNQTSENITDPLIKKQMTMNPYMDSRMDPRLDPKFNAHSCFARKHTCMPPICNISTREDRERRIRDELEEVVKNKVERIHKKQVKLVDETKNKTKSKKCTIM